MRPLKQNRDFSADLSHHVESMHRFGVAQEAELVVE
jgi:hypothetical protein